MSCSASRNVNDPTTLCHGCGCEDHDSTTLSVCHHNHPSTTLAHKKESDAIEACKKWCGDDFAEKCENTKIELGDDNHYHWSVPEGCVIQCPATGASSR